MTHVTNSSDFSHWTQNKTGNGAIQVLSDGRLRLQNNDDTSRSLLQRDIMLMAGDEVTVYCVGRTTSLSSGALTLAVEYPVGTRHAIATFNHNEDTHLVKCTFKVPTEWEPRVVRIWCGLPSNTTAIAYITDLLFEVKSQNLISRRILMDGVIDITAGVATVLTTYESSNVGDVTASSINLDIKPKSYVKGDRLPLTDLQAVFKNGEQPISGGMLVPYGNFTTGGALNIRLINPITGSAVGVTGSTINKTIKFTVYI